MAKDGGTKMYCPSCEEIQVCQAIPPSSVGLESSQRIGFTDHTDIQWFRRVRQCLDCNNVFISAEVNETFLDELVELRSALGKIKLNAERYMRESTAASASLSKLSKSLEVLRALNLYKQENIDISELFNDADEDE